MVRIAVGSGLFTRGSQSFRFPFLAIVPAGCHGEECVTAEAVQLWETEQPT